MSENTGRNLYIKNLDGTIDDARLASEFSRYGTVVSARVMTQNNRSRGYGFVSFRTREAASRAMADMSGRVLGSRRICVSIAYRGHDHQSRPVTPTNQATGSDGQRPQAAALPAPPAEPDRSLGAIPKIRTKSLSKTRRSHHQHHHSVKYSGNSSSSSSGGSYEGRAAGREVATTSRRSAGNPPSAPYLPHMSYGASSSHRMNTPPFPQNVSYSPPAPFPPNVTYGPSVASTASATYTHSSSTVSYRPNVPNAAYGCNVAHSTTGSYAAINVTAAPPRPRHHGRNGIVIAAPNLPPPDVVTSSMHTIYVEGVEPLTPAMFAAAPPRIKTEMLRKRLFLIISRMYPTMASRITQIMLEFDNYHLIYMLDNLYFLKRKIQEAASLIHYFQLRPQSPGPHTERDL